MSSFLDNAAALTPPALPVFGQTVGATQFPTSVSYSSTAGQETNPLETRNVVNNSVSGKEVLGFLGNLGGLFLNYKAAEASLKNGQAQAAAPAAGAAPAGTNNAAASLSPEAKKWLTWGAIAAAALILVSLLRRR